MSLGVSLSAASRYLTKCLNSDFSSSKTTLRSSGWGYVPSLAMILSQVADPSLKLFNRLSTYANGKVIVCFRVRLVTLTTPASPTEALSRVNRSTRFLGGFSYSSSLEALGSSAGSCSESCLSLSLRSCTCLLTSLFSFWRLSKLVFTD